MTVWYRIALVVLMVALSPACARQEPTLEWPQWRGQGGLGVSAETRLPAAWDESGDALRWQTKLPGRGTSSPVVARGTVLLTFAEKQASGVDLKVAAFDLTAGKSLWQTAVVSRPVEQLHRLHSSAGTTPASDGHDIFVYFGSHLAALDFEGAIRWLEEIDPDYVEYSRYGAGASPILVDDKVIVFRDRERNRDGYPGFLAAYSKKSGEELWRTEWSTGCCSYATPIVRSSGESSELVVSHSGHLAVYDAATGEKRWETPQKVNQPVASPVGEGELICSTTGAHQVREANCWKVGPGAGEAGAPLWSSARMVPGTSSPVLYNGRLFSLHEKGFIVSLDPATGRVLWKNRIKSGNYIASLVAGDGKLYAMSREGVVTTVAATDEFELLGESKVPDSDLVASPAIADGCLLVRTRGHLFCYAEPEA